MENDTQTLSSESTVQLSDNAAKQITMLAAKEVKSGAMLRVSVDGGGCSGFQYKYDFVWEKDEEDCIITNGEATLLVDDVSLELMQNSVVDYEISLTGACFVIKNPNATANCGCGNSFSV